MLADVVQQVVVLCLNPAFGWSSSLLAWMNDFSVLELLLPNRDPGTTRTYSHFRLRSSPASRLHGAALFNLVTCIVLFVVLGAIADAACTSAAA